MNCCKEKKTGLVFKLKHMNSMWMHAYATLTKWSNINIIMS